MELRYDFHIHSALSPCAEPEMTPYNIVMMATILDLDMIAVTDHNSVGNCRSAMNVGKASGILVIPGIELSTAEEIHMVCLFPDIDSAEAFGAVVYENLPNIKNKPEIFGEQHYLDEAETVLACEQKLLINATGIGFDQAPELVRSFGGVCYPAHIDRSSNSLLSSFGMIDPSMDFSTVEIADHGKTEGLLQKHPLLEKKKIIYSSDSHNLETFAQMNHQSIDLERTSARAVIEYLSLSTPSNL